VPALGAAHRSSEPADDSAPTATRTRTLELAGGQAGEFRFTPRDHVELELGRGRVCGGGSRRPGFDLERGARISGARFGVPEGCGRTSVELALYRYAIDRLVGRGFELVLPPVLVRESAMYGTGFCRPTRSTCTRFTSDALYLTGPPKVALAALHQGEILPAEELPLRYAGLFHVAFDARPAQPA